MDLSDDLRAQIRKRLRTWVALAGPSPALRRSNLRAQVLRLAVETTARTLEDGPPRLVITAALRHALACAWRDKNDPYGEPLAAARALVMRVGDGEADIRAWDTLLTARELRPSLAIEPLEGLRRVREQGDRMAQLDGAIRERGTPQPGPYLRRQGVTDFEGALAAFWERVEPAVLTVLPLAEARSAACHGFANLLRWDAIIGDIASRADDPEVGQATAARFLEPRVMRAYLTLPEADIRRLAGRSGKHLHLATLTDRHVATESESLDLHATERATPETLNAEAQRWRRLFEGVARGVEAGAFEARKVVFLWLSAAVGAGEAWRLAGLPLSGLGSANYHRNQLLSKLAERVGEAASRLPNPEKPDERARGLIALFNMRAGADPFVDSRAGAAPGPALNDAALLGLMLVFNLPRADATRLMQAVGCAEGPAALVARSLRAVRNDRARRAALDAVLDDLNAPQDGPDRIGDRDLLFLLTSMVIGLPSESAVRVAEADGLRPARSVLVDWLSESLNETPETVSAWLDGAQREPSPQPGLNPVLEALANCPAVPGPPPGLKRRPVEREAQLRRRLGERD